jgi:transcriptional regulator GlxA family with amidase domain
MAPMQYLRKIRVEKAAELLTHTAKTLDVVTEETGFGNKSHLAKVFKQMVGITPGQYREERKHSESKSLLQIEP